MLYNIVIYQIELAMARSGGKAVVYDVSQLPTNAGMDIQTVLYHLKTDGIIPINSKDEGNQISSFNQFQQIDFTLSQSVQQLINLKIMLEEMAGQISGVSRQREGAVGQYEYVGNVQRSVVQSATITESWFQAHSEVKQRVFERLCNLMKICWAGGKKAGMILGDGAYKFLNVLPNIALQDFGVYVGDSGKDDAMKQVVQQLSQAALQSGNVDLLNVIKVLKADTMTEAEKVLEQGMEQMKRMQDQQQQILMQQQQMAQQAKEAEIQQQLALKQVDNDAKKDIANIEAETKIKIAKMQTDAQRDINDAKESSAMIKKVADSELRMREKNQETPETTVGEKTARQELDRAVQDI
jgi:hypothetical protein